MGVVLWVGFPFACRIESKGVTCSSVSIPILCHKLILEGCSWMFGSRNFLLEKKSHIGQKKKKTSVTNQCCFCAKFCQNVKKKNKIFYCNILIFWEKNC
jgi:hypothetical protein